LDAQRLWQMNLPQCGNCWWQSDAMGQERPI
jgi:hypothetical protein